MPSYSKKVNVPGKTSKELYDKLSAEIEHFLEKAGVGKVEIQRDPAKKELQFKSAMASGTLFCKEGCMELDAKLSLLAAPFKSKIDAGIEKWISRSFPSKDKA